MDIRDHNVSVCNIPFKLGNDSMCVTKGQQVRIGAQGLRVDLDWFGPLDPLDNLQNVKQV